MTMDAIVTTHVQEMISEALDIAQLLDGKQLEDLVERDDRDHPPVMLLSLAINRLRHAAEELEATRLTYFGLPA